MTETAHQIVSDLPHGFKMIPQMRIIIAGGPRTGKTILAKMIGLPVKPADSLINIYGLAIRYLPGIFFRIKSIYSLITRGWSEASLEASRWFDDPGPWIVEGVAAGRALRKWMESHPSGKPCDLVVYLAHPKISRTPGQDAMAKGCDTVWKEINPHLERRGVKVETLGEFIKA